MDEPTKNTVVDTAKIIAAFDRECAKTTELVQKHEELVRVARTMNLPAFTTHFAATIHRP